LLGAIAFANQMPACLLGPLGGIAADRYDRHRVILVTQAAAMILAFALAALTLTHTVQVWHIFALASLLGVVNAFDIPARQSFVVDLVGRDEMVNAIALNSSSFNMARLVGPAVAGSTVALIGEGWCFFLNGVSFVAVIGSLLLMRVAKTVTAPRSGSAFAHLSEGFLFCWRNRLVRWLLFVVGITSLFAFPFGALLPVFADQILHGGPQAYGLLTAASGLGSLAGALILATRRHVHGLRKWASVFTAVGAAALFLFGLSKFFWLSMVLLLIVGIGLMLGVGSISSLIQHAAPDTLRGRVNAVYTMTFMGLAPVGSLIAGVAAEHFTAPYTVASGALVTTAAAVYFGVAFVGDAKS
jgi:MFS family permease